MRWHPFAVQSAHYAVSPSSCCLTQRMKSGRDAVKKVGPILRRRLVVHEDARLERMLGRPRLAALRGARVFLGSKSHD